MLARHGQGLGDNATKTAGLILPQRRQAEDFRSLLDAIEQQRLEKARQGNW